MQSLRNSAFGLKFEIALCRLRFGAVEDFLQTFRRKLHRVRRFGNRARQTEEFVNHAVETLRFDRHARVLNSDSLFSFYIESFAGFLAWKLIPC